MKIMIASDLVPTEIDFSNFQSGDFDNRLDLQFLKQWLNADYRIFNLECVLGDKNKFKPIHKAGPNLIAPSDCINGIKKLNPDLILLSNNHTLDFGEEGLLATIEILKQNGIAYTGVIENSLDSLEPFFIEKDDIKIGIYNVCENEFSVATKTTFGANGLNELKNYKEIKKLKEQCDQVIVIFHGGKEFYRYPSLNIQRICRNFIDFGADLVITQHSHCIGCEEIYENKKIVYGQGNFIFNGGDDEYWNSELVLTLDVSKNNIDLDYIFLEKKENELKVVKDNKLLKEYKKRTEQAKDTNFLEQNYKNFSLKSLNFYLLIMNRFTFYNRVMNRLSRRSYFIKRYKVKDYLAILNIFECEAHRELVIAGLKNKINELLKDEK